MARTASPFSLNHANSFPSPSNRNDSYRVEWTVAHEERLLLVQDQLQKAQRDWSEEQDLWLEEAQTLQDLKRKYKKAMKKATKSRAKKTAALWKSKPNVSSPPAMDSGNEADSDDANGDESPLDDKTQEPSRSPFKTILRRIKSSSSSSKPSRRRSTHSEGDPSSDWEPMHHPPHPPPPPPPGIGNRLRRWSTRGGSGRKVSFDELSI